MSGSVAVMKPNDVSEPRHRHLELVATRPRLRHPSMHRTEMFDQEQLPADSCVVIPRIQAQLIASLLNSARPHLPSPKAVDEAISILMGTS